jgi:hypothetical protein
MFFMKKPQVYLKTYIYAPHEVKFVRLNVREALHYVDKVIVCEFNRTHTGIEREFIFDQYLDMFSSDEREKILYLRCDISDQVTYAKNADEAHENEHLMRGYFASQIDLHDSDIVISVDADEIIFSNSYKDILSHIGYFNKAVKLQLYQFFYRINYLWENEKFIAPTACQAGFYKGMYPAQWRYHGELLPKYVGCHFSWCMSADEMVKKIELYAHHHDYQHLSKRDILEEAIKHKTYPFDPNRDFRIRILDMHKDKQYFPKSIYTILDDFVHLIAEE